MSDSVPSRSVTTPISVRRSRSKPRPPKRHEIQWSSAGLRPDHAIVHPNGVLGRAVDRAACDLDPGAGRLDRRNQALADLELLEVGVAAAGQRQGEDKPGEPAPRPRVPEPSLLP